MTIAVSTVSLCAILSPSIGNAQTTAGQFVSLAHRAVNGDIKAQVELGASWIVGDYGRRDYKQAVYWFESSCTRGSMDGCAWLGSCKILGRGVPFDSQEGMRLVEGAFAAGSATAMRIKADLLSSGDWANPYVGPPFSDLYVLAALRGDAIANDKVGIRFLNGSDHARNLTKAAKFFYVGALLGNADSQLHLGQMYESGREFEDPTPESIRSGRTSIEMAMYMYQKASDKNNRIAQYRWASLLANGASREENLTHARELYEMSSLHQYGPARLALAQMLEKGQGGPTDIPRALALFWDATAKNMPGADEAAHQLEAKNSDETLAKARVTLKTLQAFDSKFLK